MKIAVVSSFRFPVTQPYSSGLTAFIDQLSQGLARYGVEVICYACEGSTIPGVEVRTLGIQPTSGVPRFRSSSAQRPDDSLEQVALIRAIAHAANDRQIDLIHSSSYLAAAISACQTSGKPVVQTIHIPPAQDSLRRVIASVTGTNMCIVCVSRRHARQWTKYRPNIEVVSNGIPLESMPTPAYHDGWFAFVGRIHPSKGLIDAIKVAAALRRPLKIFGAPDAFVPQYYTDIIQPLTESSPIVEYCGSLPHNALYEQLKHAQALLFPIKWAEPFGYAAVEAMALGVPALTYNRGAACEIIENNATGYVVPSDDLNALQHAAVQSAVLDRENCASITRRRFDHEHTLAQYVNIYSTLLSS